MKGRDGTEATDAPPRDRPYDRLEIASPSGELVYGGCRRGGEPAPGDDTAALELVEPDRQRVSADAGQSRLEIDKPLRPGEELTDDEQSPAFADDVERTGDRTVLIILALRHGTRMTIPAAQAA